MDSDLFDVLARANAAFNAALETEAAELGITVDELERRRQEAAFAEREAERSSAARRRRLQIVRPYAERIGRPIVEAIANDAVETSSLVLAVRDFMDHGDRPMLVVSGGVGVGKTCAAIAALVRHGHGVYCHAADLASRYETWSADARRGVEPIDMSTSFLVLDDLGSERGDDPRFAEAIGQTIDRRIGPGITPDGEIYRRVTIITTNILTKDLGEKYGARIADRLYEHAQAMNVRDQVSRRRTK